MPKHPPRLGFSDMTRRFYVVTATDARGAATSKHDITDQVLNVVSHARGPLETAIEDALAVAENTIPGYDPKLSPWCDLIAALQADWMDVSAHGDVPHAG